MRVPKKLDSLLYIAAQYSVVRKSWLSECVHQRTLKQQTDRMLITELQKQFPRSTEKTCEPGSAHLPVVPKDDVDEEVEPAELVYDANWEFDLQEYCRDIYHFKHCS